MSLQPKQPQQASLYTATSMAMTITHAAKTKRAASNNFEI